MSSIKDKLAAGAAAIKAADTPAKAPDANPKSEKKKSAAKKQNKKAAKKPAKKANSKSPEPPPTTGTLVVFPPVPRVLPSKRGIMEILADRAKLTHHNTSIEIAKDTPIDEHLSIFAYFAANVENAGFLMGDVINAGQTQHGAKYDAAVAQTEYSLSTLKQFAYVARNVPANLRDLHPALKFSHLAQVARIEDKTKMKEVLVNAKERIEKGDTITKKDVARIADRIVPKAKKAPPKTPKKKTASSTTPEAETYTPTAAEDAQYEDFIEKADTLATVARDPLFQTLCLKLTNAKKVNLTDVLKHIVKLSNLVESKTGYVGK